MPRARNLPAVAGSGSERLPAYSGATVPDFTGFLVRERLKVICAASGVSCAAGGCRQATPQPGRTGLSIMLFPRGAVLAGLIALAAFAPAASQDEAAHRLADPVADRGSVRDRRRTAGRRRLGLDRLPAAGDARCRSSRASRRSIPSGCCSCIPTRSSAFPRKLRSSRICARAGLRPALLADDSYDDIFRDLIELGRLAVTPSEARALETRLRARTSAARAQRARNARGRACSSCSASRRSTRSSDSSYIAQLIALAGGRNAAGNLKDAYRAYSAEALRRAATRRARRRRQSGLARRARPRTRGTRCAPFAKIASTFSRTRLCSSVPDRVTTTVSLG